MLTTKSYVDNMIRTNIILNDGPPLNGSKTVTLDTSINMYMIFRFVDGLYNITLPLLSSVYDGYTWEIRFTNNIAGFFQTSCSGGVSIQLINNFNITTNYNFTNGSIYYIKFMYRFTDNTYYILQLLSR